MRRLVILLFLAQAVQGQAGLPALPSGVPISEEQILKMLVPNYEQQRKDWQAKLRADPSAHWDMYQASVVSARRTNLGISGEDFLVAAIEENAGVCHFCNFSIFGGVDLKRMKSMGSFRSAEASSPDEARSLVLLKAPKAPWRLSFKYEFEFSAGSGSVEWERTASVERDDSLAWHLRFGRVVEPKVNGTDQ